MSNTPTTEKEIEMVEATKDINGQPIDPATGTTREQDRAIYRMVAFWNDIRRGEHDAHLQDMLDACAVEVNERIGIIK
jgi:hypothetical protein